MYFEHFPAALPDIQVCTVVLLARYMSLFKVVLAATQALRHEIGVYLGCQHNEQQTKPHNS